MPRSSRSGSAAGRSFVKRAFLPRAIGLAVGSFAVTGVLWGLETPPWLWGVLIAYCYLWPPLAYWIAQRSQRPFVVERRQVLFDSLMGGFWIAAMQFSVLPSVMLLSMLAMNNTATGGARVVVLGLLAQLLGMLLYGATMDWGFDPRTSQQMIYACIPMLVVHPMTIGLVLYRLTIQLGRSKKALRELSRTDSLTGLLNRGYWAECQEWLFQQCRREGRPASLALIDVDHFKTTNDSHGHLLGDEVLRRLAEVMKTVVRAQDLAGRYGGDEFCILLPSTTPAQACALLERLRGEVAALRFVEAPALRVSLSIGVAGFTPALVDGTAWLKAADQALYEAKRCGRDRIVLADAAGLDAGFCLQ